MNRRLVAVLFVALAVVASARVAAAQNVDEIIAKNIAAKGGAEKLRAVRSMKQTSHSGAASLVVYGKRPNLNRQEITSPAGQVMILAFDGTTAWAQPFGAPMPMAASGEDAIVAKEQSDFDGPLVDYRAKGYTVQLAGTETVGARKLYHLKVTSRDARVQHVYLDTVTGLEAKIVTDSPMGTLEQELSDYRDVQGIKVPFSIRNLVNGAVRAEIVVDKVEINPVIDDAIFRMKK